MAWPQIKRSHKEDLEKSKSRVRVRVTYAATAFIFAIGGLLVLALLFEPYLALVFNYVMGHLPRPADASPSDMKVGGLNFTDAKDLFLAILPVASGIIAFWFGNRKSEAPSTTEPHNSPGDGGKQDDEGKNRDPKQPDNQNQIVHGDPPKATG